MVRVSIIIPTYNEARYIGRTLRSIMRQGYRDTEVIIADSRSTDGTLEVARAVSRDVRAVVEDRKGVSRAYNKAAKAAKGDLLLFIDADTSISAGLLRAYDRAFRSDDIVAATGPIRPLERTGWNVALGYKIVSVYLTKLFIAVGRPAITGSNFMVSRRAFARVGGFDESLMTYFDWDLSHRLGKAGKIRFIDEAVVYTSARRILAWGSLRYFTYHASNALLYTFRHKARDDYGAVR
jgi:glycosyltransferase involved in cell wall biosynthesis